MNPTYAEQVRILSDRIVDAQRPIRVLDAIKWSDRIKADFLEAEGRDEPRIDRAYYDTNPLPFDPSELHTAFGEIESDVATRLGRTNPAGQILQRMCREYREVIDMLQARGTPQFSTIAQRLYGRSTVAFHGGPTLVDLATTLDEALTNIHAAMFFETDAADIPTDRAVSVLQERLDRVFPDPAARVRVCVSDGIVADAAAGSDYIKLRAGTNFSDRDLRLLEVHEGWVHVGTTLNGRAQPYCTFLSKGTPSSTITQEGLAVLVEVVSFTSHPARLRRITDRIHCVHLAEEGATFRDVYRHLREDGRSAPEAYTIAMRVFRGSTPTGGPFPKDLAYSRGFVEIYTFLQLAVKLGKLDRLALLFAGKLTLEDLGLLAHLADQGLVTPPDYLPVAFADANALTAWMAYSTFLNRVDLGQAEADFAPLLG